MSKLEEKNIAMTILRDTFQRLGLADTPAAQNVIAELEKRAIPSALVNDVDNLIGVILLKRKQKAQAAMAKVWNDIPEG